MRACYFRIIIVLILILAATATAFSIGQLDGHSHSLFGIDWAEAIKRVFIATIILCIIFGYKIKRLFSSTKNKSLQVSPDIINQQTTSLDQTLVKDLLSRVSKAEGFE